MIKSTGVEIEGAWQILPEAFFNNDNKHGMKVYRSDGSVSGLDELHCNTCNKNERYCNCEVKNFDINDTEQNRFKYVGEIASYPYNNINNLLLFIEKYYPEKTNKTCGIHTHLKPSNLGEYQQLMSKKYYRDFLNAIEFWAKSRNINQDSELYRRLKGKNNYCQKGFRPAREGQDPPHYTMINYCYAKHGTIEIRLLPAFQSMKLAKDAVRFIYDFTNIWLATNEKYAKNKKASKIIDLGEL